MYSYCTLFDKNYLDKGLVLINSFRKYNQSGKLYVLAMDDICFDCIKEIGLEGIIPIKLTDFETDELLQAKGNRSRGEYCWTCASNLIYYIFQVYKEPYCTYIDADLCFFANPDILVDEMIESGKSVQIIEHRFKQDFYGRFQQKISGYFCVEFNTFKNDSRGLSVLDKWRKQTLKQCSFAFGTDKLGDQMYLDEWPKKYPDDVNVLKNLGAGIAPWNLNRYTWLKEDVDDIWVTYDKRKEPIQVIFFHYHGLNYIDRNHIDIKVHKRFWKVDMKLAMRLYDYYLEQVEIKKEWIEKKYDFLPLVQGDALGLYNKKSWGERIMNLFKGNLYENVRFRIESYIKILLFGNQDIICLKDLYNNEINKKE